MARFYWCKLCETTHQRTGQARNCDPEPWPRSDLPAPHIISDNLPGGVNGLYHHAVCKKIDSKSAYRRATREAGCIEVGNERAAMERFAAESRNRPIPQDVIESGVNDALARHGITSENDTENIDYAV